jgi:hypothetical protein
VGVFRILDVAVAKPILHEPHVGAGVKKMRRDAVFEDVKCCLSKGSPARAPYVFISQSSVRRRSDRAVAGEKNRGCSPE